MVFLCHVFGPFLQRIEQEKPNAVAGIAILLYEMLEVVDKQHGPAPLEYLDPICDFLYHIKYIHVGNIIKNESEAIIKRLRPALQMRLRFISHLNIEDKHLEKSCDNIQQQLPTSNVNPSTLPATATTMSTSSFPSTSIQQNFSNLQNQQQQQQPQQQATMPNLSNNVAVQQTQVSSNPSPQMSGGMPGQMAQQQTGALSQQQQMQQMQLQQQLHQQQFQLQQQQMQQQLQQQHMQQQQGQPSNMGGAMRHN